MAVKVEHFDLVTMGQIDIKGKTHVVLKGRNLQREAKIHIVPVKPYFYAGVDEEEISMLEERGVKITRDVLGRPTRKINLKLSGDVGKFRELYPFTCEANVNMYERYVIDKGIYTAYTKTGNKIERAESKGIPPKIMYFDVEESVHPDYQVGDGLFPIVSIQCGFNYGWGGWIFVVDPYNKYPDKKFVSFGERMIDEEVMRRVGMIGLNDFGIWMKVKRYKEVPDLLKGFIKFMREQNPDFLKGWWSNYFDIPEIIKQMRQYNIDQRWLSPLFNKDRIFDPDYRKLVALPKKREEQTGAKKYFQTETPHILGRECVDMLDQTKKINLTSQKIITSYDLKDMAKNEICFVYKDIGAEFRKYHLEHPEEALDYMAKDWLVLKLFDMATGHPEHYQNYRELFGVRINDTMSFNRGYKVLALRLSDKPVPTKSPSIKRKKQKGADVITPARGKVIKFVAWFDFKSLYPYIQEQENATLENLIDLTDRIAIFNKDTPGLMVRALKRVNDKRNEQREEGKKYNPNVPYERFMKDRIGRMEKSTKSAAASAYGVTGYAGNPLYSWEANQKITFEGRAAIRELIRLMEENGFEVVYGDTDSVAVALEILVEDYDDIIDAYVKSGMIVEAFLNFKLGEYAKEREWATPPIVKFEKLAKNMIFQYKRGENVLAKKKYSMYLVWKDGYRVNELVNMGIQSKRSDTAELTRTLMNSFLRTLLQDENLNGALNLVKDYYRRVESGDVTQEEIGVPHGLRTTRESYWVRKAVDYAEREMGEYRNPNMKPKILYVKTVKGKPTTKHLAIINDNAYDESIVKINYPLTADKLVKNKINPFLRSLGYTFKELLKGQTKLEAYF